MWQKKRERDRNGSKRSQNGKGFERENIFPFCGEYYKGHENTKYDETTYNEISYFVDLLVSRWDSIQTF